MDWSQSQTKLFRALLRFFPAEFRNEYGAEMEHLFADRLRAESSWRLWLDTASDLALSALKEHSHILVSDLRYGTRALAAAPAFAAIALLVIALGIGATVSVFSLVNAVLLRSLPFGHPEKLVYLWSPNSNFKGVPQELGPNVPDFYDWQRRSCFSALALFMPVAVNIVEGRSAERIGAAFVTGDFFRTLEAWPEFGRALNANDDRPGQERVAIISNSFWRSRFGASLDAIGKTVRVNRLNYTLVGVMPKDFGYPLDGDVPYERSGFRQTDIWLPAAYTDDQKSNRTNFKSAVAIGRVAPGIAASAAQAELSALELRLQPLYPEMWRGWTVLVRPLVETIIGPVQTMLWLLLGAVGVVLLIAISNVANLLLLRATARSHELGIRTALGAERGRIIRQLLTESLLLSGVGGALGVVLAFAAVYVLRRLNPGDIPRFDAAAVDGRALLVAVTLSILTGVVSGLLPAISASRSEINHLLRSGGAQMGGNANRGQFSLVALEVALSVLLLMGSGLLIRSYLQLAAIDPGFSPATLTFRLSLDERYSKPEQRTALYKSFLARLQTLPGIDSVGASTSNPLTNQESVSYAETQGFGRTPEMVETRSVTPAYRKALGTPLLRGRDFDPRDVASKAPLVMVNETFAKKYFHGRDPLGKQIRIGMGDLSKAPWLTVIGIVADIRHNNLEEASRPSLFQPADSGDNFAIQCRAPVSQVLARARTALRSLDPSLTLEGVHTMRERMNESNARRTFQTSLLTGFAAIAIALALIGLYGLMSYTVKQRTREIAIRLAVGAPRSRILRLLLSQGLRPTALGLLIGLGSAFALTRLLTSWLFEIKAIDPLTFVAVPGFVLVVAALACLVPAWTATRIDPIHPLRNE